ncbi:MAG: glycosyltransferase family 9 protein [Deltaproteobacteria bacterium]|nr:glycosyltransferase family 9 protein [Deltaproteobacteria bacterium]
MSNQVPPPSLGRAGALVVFPGALGDLLCAMPAMREIYRRHGGRVTVLCKGDLVPLVRAAEIGDAAPIEGRAAAWLFAAEPPPEADAFFAAFAVVESFSGSAAPEVARNLGRWLGHAARVHPFRPPVPRHLAEHFLGCIGAPRAAAEIATVEVSAGEAAVAAARARMAALPRPVLAVHPGSGGRSKRWSRSGFVEIADRWRARGGGVVIVLGPAEAGESSLWKAAGVVLEPPSVLELAAQLGAADAYLGNDSGASHLAGAVGVRGAAVFGPTDPALWRPLSPRIVACRLAPWTACEEAAPRAAVDAVDRALVPAATSP